LAGESIRTAPAAGLEGAAGLRAEIAATGEAAAAAPFRHEGALEALGEILAVVTAHDLVADAVAELVDARLQSSAALGRDNAAAFELARPDHVRKRPRRRDDFLDRAAAARAHEIVGVLPLRQKRKAQALSGREERQGKVRSTISGLLAGLVAVEAEDRLVR